MIDPVEVELYAILEFQDHFESMEAIEEKLEYLAFMAMEDLRG